MNLFKLILVCVALFLIGAATANAYNVPPERVARERLAEYMTDVRGLTSCTVQYVQAPGADWVKNIRFNCNSMKPTVWIIDREGNPNATGVSAINEIRGLFASRGLVAAGCSESSAGEENDGYGNMVSMKRYTCSFDLAPRCRYEL